MLENKKEFLRKIAKYPKHLISQHEDVITLQKYVYLKILDMKKMDEILGVNIRNGFFGYLESVGTGYFDDYRFDEEYSIEELDDFYRACFKINKIDKHINFI